jgi:hypothetical protein
MDPTARSHDSMGDRDLRSLNERLRAAFIDGAEEDSRRRLGRGLNAGGARAGAAPLSRGPVSAQRHRLAMTAAGLSLRPDRTLDVAPRDYSGSPLTAHNRGATHFWERPVTGCVRGLPHGRTRCLGRHNGCAASWPGPFGCIQGRSRVLSAVRFRESRSVHGRQRGRRSVEAEIVRVATWNPRARPRDISCRGSMSRRALPKLGAR